MSAPPKVSVLIPTYQYARFLPDAIESVLAQDFADFEVIVADDASTDNSAEIVRGYAARDPRIRFQRHEKNLGMVANWNWCLRQARAPYIKFGSGDDCLVSRQALSRLAGMLDAAPGAVLAVSARLVIDENSRPVEIWDDLRRPGIYPGPEMIARCLRQDRNLIGEPSAVMFRAAAGRRGFDPDLRQVVDLEMWFDLLISGDLAFDPEPLCGFRRHSAQQTAVNRQSHVGPTESLRITARYLDVLRDRAHLGPFALRSICYRSLYYSRKRAPRVPEIMAMEDRLRARLSPGWRGLLWIVHRVAKPFSNLGRAWRRRFARSAAPLPASLRIDRLRWTPP